MNDKQLIALTHEEVAQAVRDWVTKRTQAPESPAVMVSFSATAAQDGTHVAAAVLVVPQGAA